MPIQMKLAVISPVLLAVCVFLFAEDDGFKPIFDGKTLEGWVREGGEADYKVEDGAVVGTAVPKT
ncbi:MAG: DUF1080 domain-containing protein, partial [Planctomycetes bacterium]|nr:DUF1080 domain-containing protein [Planctomycetota bacterium]